jgi:hypothetical protein
MALQRRTVLAGLAATAMAPLAGGKALAQSARREFNVLRGGSEIGRHIVSMRRDGAELHVEIEVELVVRILGIAAFRYEMTNRETWRNGRLVAGDSVVNDDGRRKRVVSRREGGVLMVESPDFTGQAPDDVATTTYFTPDFLGRTPWLSTDSGELMSVRTTRVGAASVDTGSGRVDVTRWRASDGGAFDVMLDYDDRGEWLSVGFDARGEPLVYVPRDTGPAFGPIWRGA